MADTKSGNKAAGAADKTNGATAAAPQAAPAGPAARKAGMTKMEAVKQALLTLGSDAKPLQIQSYVSDTFNIEMTGAHVSDCKKKLLKRAATGSQTAAPAKKPASVGPSAATPSPKKAPSSNVPAATKPAAPRPKVASPAPAVAPSRTNGGGKSAGGGSVLLEDVLTAKALLERVGADNLRTLIDGLAK